MSHIKKATLFVAASVLNISSVCALENLNEEDLANVTGQDGISVLVVLPTAGWTAQSIGLTDKGVLPADNATLLAIDVGVKVCYEATINGTCGVLGKQGIKFNMDFVGDSDGAGSGGAMLNIQSQLFGAAKKLRVYIDSIELRNSAGGNKSTIIDFNNPDSSGKDYFDLMPSDGKLFTLQLGSETASSHMFSFGTTVFNTIDFGEIRLTDKADTGVAGNGRNLRFKLRLDNVDLTGAGLDINPTGLMFTTPGLTNMNVTFSDIIAGSNNTSMGTIGIQGLNLSNHRLTITGKI